MKVSLRQLLMPTYGQTLGCLGFGILVIGLLYRSQFLDRIHGDVFSQAFKQISYGDKLSGWTDTPLVHTFVIVAFWSAVGLVAYTIVWSFINVLIEARNEVVLETEYTNQAAFWQRSRLPLTQLGLAVALFVALLLSARFIFPLWLNLVSTGLASDSISLILYTLVAVIGFALTAYVLIVLGQLVFWVD